MAKKKRAIVGTWSDPDDAPELTDEWFATADRYRGAKLVRRGRPRSEFPKKSVNIRLDQDVLAHYRAAGPGWQSRINQTLRKAAKLKARA
ncbi:MAG: BrnA antitoxin family protein [Alphaproteobacteria bacterium]|nr:BrnA antitoxin family protein [Alphaproteobacteria bacterium]